MTEPAVEIRAAETPADVAAVRDICRDFYVWLRERYAAHAWIVDTYYPEEEWERLLDDLPRIHARPEGGIWIALAGGKPVGTIMLKGLDTEGDCEMKRLMVRTEARGLGVGRALVGRLVSEAHLAGYRRLLFDAGARHLEALKLYRSLGFVERTPYYDVPADLITRLVFFEGDLATLAARM